MRTAACMPTRDHSVLLCSEYTDGSHASPPLTTLVVSLAQLDMLSLLDVVSAHADVMVTITDGDTNVLQEVRRDVMGDVRCGV